ncbi:MAG TPA: aminotransferase class III-fold pyridoxal phosphate-dependent enzyme [Bacteroidia bacterium]
MKPFDVYHLADIELKSALGSYVFDSNGRKYLDFYGGHAVISIGHSHPLYVSMLTEQLSKIAFYSNSLKISRQTEVAERLGRLSGLNDYNVFFCNSGAEANENAIKLASFKTGRKKVIAFQGAFHGRTSMAIEMTDNTRIQAPINQNGNVVRIPLNDQEAFDAVMNEDIAAVIVEGIQGVAGIVEPEHHFLNHIEKKCKSMGAALILDEVQSGMGRTGSFFAFQAAGIQPDLISMAKGIGNGFPVAALLISPKYEAVKEQLGTTFGGAHLACTAVDAVLQVFEREQLQNNVNEMGNYMKAQLGNLKGLKKYKGRGFMVGLEFEFPVTVMRKQLMNEYSVLTGTSSDPNTIRLLPALNIGRTEIDQLKLAFERVLNHD